jgi:hypothetical protein
VFNLLTLARSVEDKRQIISMSLARLRLHLEEAFQLYDEMLLVRKPRWNPSIIVTTLDARAHAMPVSRLTSDNSVIRTKTRPN